jgi:hypothetical protein
MGAVAGTKRLAERASNEADGISNASFATALNGARALVLPHAASWKQVSSDD